jgi:hypothetical protein
MTDPHQPDDDDRDSRAIRDLVKRSLSADAGEGDAPDLVLGVQRRLRKRSRGKFFADGWSTAQNRTSYVLVALVTLLLVALAYFSLGPMDVR